MTSPIRILMASLAAACVLGGGTAQAQDEKSNTRVTISDEKGRRHIVVERNGKIIKDEWVDAKGGKSYIIVTDKDGNVKVQPGDATGIVTFGGKNGVQMQTPPSIVYRDAPGFHQLKPGKVDTIVQGGRYQIAPGQGGVFKVDTDGKGYRIVTPGKNGAITVPGGSYYVPSQGVKPGKDGQTFRYVTPKNFQYVPGKVGSTTIQAGPNGYTIVRDGKPVNVLSGQGLTFGRNNLEGLLHSLTREQRAKQSSRGYLTLGDLTPAQRRMFNAPKGGDWNIVFESNGEKIVLRSK